MTHSELSKGLVLLFGSTLPKRIKTLEKYLQSHIQQRAKQYLASSMELSLKKETPKGARKINHL